MRFRQLMKLFVPPVLVALVRRRRLFEQSNFIWQGIYPHRRDVPTRDGSYDDDAQVERHVTWTRRAYELARESKNVSLWHQTLAVVAATAGAKSGVIRVLDFGGAVGSGYVQLLADISQSILIEYHIVELQKMCVAGRKLFADDKQIMFHADIPNLEEVPDIVYANGVFPYVDDYRAMLTRLASMGANYILLAGLAAGDIPTYATRQMNLEGKALAYWFLNCGEIIDALAAAGYAFIYEGQEGPEFDQSNFPETHRIGKMRAMLFRKS